MKITTKEYSAYLLCLIINVVKRDGKTAIQRKSGDTDESIKIKNDFQSAPSKIAKMFNVSASTGMKWTRGWTEGEQAKSLFALWKKGYIEIKLTEKGGKNRNDIRQYLGKDIAQKKQEPNDLKKWSKKQIQNVIYEEIRRILKK